MDSQQKTNHKPTQALKLIVIIVRDGKCSFLIAADMENTLKNYNFQKKILFLELITSCYQRIITRNSEN